jgi:type I restriction enzyme S subunit
MGADMDAAELPALPEGWEWKEISEVISPISLNKKKVAQKNYLEFGQYPIIDQGQKFIGGYTNDEDTIINVESPIIIFGDHTRIVKYIDFSFAPGADGIKALKPDPKFNPKLFYYFLQAIELPNKGYARHFQYLQKSNISLPPIDKQLRLVEKIEELFTQLDAAEAALKRAKANLVRYRQSVLQAAVTGELTREWREAHAGQIEPASVLLERIRAERRAKWEADLRAKGKDPSKVKYEEPAAPDTSTLPELPERWMWTTVEEVGIVYGGFTKNPERGKYHLQIPYLSVANVYANELRLEDVQTIGVTEEELSSLTMSD